MYWSPVHKLQIPVAESSEVITIWTSKHVMQCIINKKHSEKGVEIGGQVQETEYCGIVVVTSCNIT